MQAYVDFAARHWELFGLLALVSAMFVGNEIYRQIRGATGLAVSDALRLHNDEDATLLDLREVSEFREGHIPAARNVPLSALQDKLLELRLPKDRPIILYCRTGSRSASACSQLRKQGYAKAYNLTGGLLAWEQAGLPVAKGRK
jgi:rhodanese-related sulfurtransferase